MTNLEREIKWTKEVLENGGKLVLIQHTMNEYCDPYRRHVSLWVISDKLGAQNLADLVEDLGVAKRLKFKDQFSITAPSSFIHSFIIQMTAKYGLNLPDFNGFDVDGYYRWIAA